MQSVGDFNLLCMDLTSTTGSTQSLRYVFLEFNVYEDIWSNQITCNILINDARDLLINFPQPLSQDGIFGYETLNLEFQTPNGDIWSNELRLVGITDRRLIRDKELGYILHFVSKEAVLNLATRVSKAYKGVLISDMVNDIHTNIMGGDTINVESTKYQQHFIIPNIYPTQAINWLATRANPASYSGANYLYFQDKDQFNFVSMESCLAQPSSMTYLFQIANVPRQYKDPNISVDSDQIAAEQYTFDHFSNILENMQAGMYGNQLFVHSQINKLWTNYTFDYPTSFSSYQHLYPNNPLYSKGGIGSPVNTPNSKLKFQPDGPPDFPFLPQAWVPIRISQLQQLQNVKLTLTIPGDSNRTVGQIITFNLPSPEPLQSDQQINDKYYQGKFLVASVRHLLNVDKYTTVLELIKDSVFTPYPNS
jgi:hypothetical protein